jgi:hypothetical protein
MAASRSAGFTATLLPNGEVLVVGGVNEFGSCLSAAELYNPTTGRWTSTGSMSEARCYHSATLLSTGNVLVAGGSSTSGINGIPGPTVTSAELYNPSTGEWQTTGSPNLARENAAATLLANGEVLLAGGVNVNDEGSKTVATTAELYNPSSGVWSVTGSPLAGLYPSSALLENNDVLFTNQFYSPATASWTATGPVPRQASAPRLVTMLPTGNVLGSGTTCKYSGCGGVPTTFCYLYTTKTNSWSLTGSMNQARLDYTSTLLLNGKVLIAGGFDRTLSAGETILSSAELYTP